MTTNTTITPELLDQLLANYEKPEDLTGDDGLFKQLKKALIERALGAELTEHLGYEKGDPAGRGKGNSRNGASSKTVLTEDGEVEIAVPRDRAGSFEPQLIAKGQTRFDGFDDKILSLYARGMTVREIQGHVAELYGTEVSPDLISRVTDAVIDEVREGQNRPLDPGYPVGFFRGPRAQSGRREGSSWAVDRADRRRQVLAQGRQRAQGARRQRHSHCGGRWAQGLPGSDHVGVPADRGADLHRAPDPQQPGLRVVEGPQGDPARHQGDLPGRERRYGDGPARGVRGRMG